MKSIDRRKFLVQGGMGLGAAILATQLPNELFAAFDSGLIKRPFGFQSYPIRDRLSKDFAGTLKLMAGMGYQEVEMCSPSGYSTIGFAAIAKLKTAEVKTIITDAGLSCKSCHFVFGELTNKLDDTIAFSQELGLTNIICSTFWLPKTATLDDYKKAADKLNVAAEKIKKAGMQAGFHNHDFEFKMLEGELIYDVLMNRLDPSLVKMQFQTEVINYGYKAATYFEKYPGRFISAHLSDWTAEKKQVPIGKGVIDWKEFFKAAKTGGVETCYVEMDYETYEESAKFLKA
ncbi:MAG: sugar phosphate isomerase/epimerase [Chitinophagaceae bacterium]|nr:sugar phosphate isomerase/epimerase [Chitinophagaceae bacterium]